MFFKSILFKSFVRHFLLNLLLTLTFVTLAFVTLAFAVFASHPVSARSFVNEQEFQAGVNEPIQYTLLPIDAENIELQTFMVDFFLATDQAGVLTVDVELLYRVHNQSDSATTLFLRVAPNGEISEPGAGLSNPPAIAVDGQGISLQQADNSSLRTQIQLAPDGRSDVTLRYTLDYRGARLPKLRYAIDWLDEWEGEQSLRVSIALPQAIAPESWVRIDPQGWKYALSNNPQQPDIKWLFEAQQPTGDFVFQIISPNVWSQIAALTAQADDPATALSAYSQLGDLYRQLNQDQTINDLGGAGEEAIRERFYAAALAAFTSGLEQAVASDLSVEASRLHASLAGLYRSRVVAPNGQSNELYAALMQDEAVAALDALPLDDPRWAELTRWRSEGLLVQFEALQKNGEWIEALSVLDELETLIGAANNHLLSPEKLAADRRSIRLQQALELLQSNNRDAALALAGEELTNDTFQPPAETRSLFEGWRITTTIGINSIELELLGQPEPAQGQAPREALQRLTDQWRTSSISDLTAIFDEVPVAGSVTPSLRLRISLTDIRQSSSLAQLTPTDANWALLRVLLFQLNPTVVQSSSTLWEQVELAQSLDLRTAGDHWSAMAISLEQQAEQFSREAARLGDPNAEQSVQAQIQAVNYRNAAQAWRSLAQNSWVTVTLQAAVGTQSDSRSWVADVSTPPQQLKIDAQFINLVRLLGSIVVLLFGLFLLSGLLWWLL